MANPLPEWAQVGAEAAIYYNRYPRDPSVTLVSVERLTASQVITSNGDRWVNVSSSNEAVLLRAGKGRHDSPTLIAASDPRVVDAQVVAEIRRAEMDVHNAYDAWRGAPRDVSLGTALAEAASKQASLVANNANSKKPQ